MPGPWARSSLAPKRCPTPSESSSTITTWGESHGAAVGVVIDGCPGRLPLAEADIQADLDRRRPGQSAIVTPRKETDMVEILSGVFEGRTTGAPISDAGPQYRRPAGRL